MICLMNTVMNCPVPFKVDNFWSSQITLGTKALSTLVRRLVSCFCISVALFRIIRVWNIFNVNTVRSPWFLCFTNWQFTVFSSHLHLLFPSGFFQWDFPTKQLYIFLVFLMHALYHALLIIFNLIPQIVWGAVHFCKVVHGMHILCLP